MTVGQARGRTAVASAPAGRAGVRSRERSPGLVRSRSPRALGLAMAVVALALVCMASLAIGSRSVPAGAVVDALTSYDATNSDELIVREVRGPRTLIGLMVGIALGLAGALIQGVTRNPLGDPAILGLSAGAALAAALAVLVFGIGSFLGSIWFAFAGAAIGGAVVYGVASLGREGPTPVKLALAGAAVTALLTSLTTMIVLIDLETLNALRFWVVGSLARTGGTVVSQVAPFIAVGVVMALASGRVLNALSLGDDVARSLGQKVGRARATTSLAVVLLVGAATAAAGPIVFVGLVIPHVARAITGPDYRWILPYSAVLGPILLLGSDIIGRVVVRPEELQVAIVMSLLGAPFFIALVRQRKLAEL
jgi:iron complex transport system permease protein